MAGAAAREIGAAEGHFIEGGTAVDAEDVVKIVVLENGIHDGGGGVVRVSCGRWGAWWLGCTARGLCDPGDVLALIVLNVLVLVLVDGQMEVCARWLGQLGVVRWRDGLPVESA